MYFGKGFIDYNNFTE